MKKARFDWNKGCWNWSAAALLFAAYPTMAATIEASRFAMLPGDRSQVVVRGVIDNEMTFGVTVMLELVPRLGAKGALKFTGPDTPPLLEHVRLSAASHRERGLGDDGSAEPGIDVTKSGEVWPGVGAFTPFDTDRTGATSMNGAVEDNGSFVPTLVHFTGDLAMFPVEASDSASGIWDVRLVTTSGESGWEGVATTLIAGEIQVTLDACLAAAECDDEDGCTADACVAGLCRNVCRRGCDDDPQTPESAPVESAPRVRSTERKNKP